MNRLRKKVQKKPSESGTMLLKKIHNHHPEGKMIDITELFCSVHDLWKNFETPWKQTVLLQQKSPPKRYPGLDHSEVMTIVILF